MKPMMILTPSDTRSDSLAWLKPLRFFEAPVLDELDEVSLGVRRDDDIEVRREASIGR